MPYCLGIDGGGTKTRCVLGDDNRPLATATTGPSNIIRVGVASAREALLAGVHGVCEAAKIRPQEISSVCIGAAGADREEVAAQIREIFRQVTPAHVEVAGDTVIALEAAFGSGPGVVAISGTGSIIYGRNSRGETARAGGWGYAISDEGSAQWIGRRAVSAILRAHDEGAETLLSARVLKAWDLRDLDGLVQKANAIPPPEFPTLFPIVLRAANDGDDGAGALLRDAGWQLADQAAIVLRRLFAASGSRLSADARVAITGSVFRQSEVVRQCFYNELQARFPGLEVGNDFVEPVEGALARARRAAGGG